MILQRKPFMIVVLMCTVFLVLHTAFGEEQVLQKTKKAAVVDGVVQPNEYSFTYEADEINLYLNWIQGKLYAAIIADTNGWVGIGFNSQKMNDADILIGYVKGGETSFQEQIGKGHKHRDKDLPYLKSFSLKESGGKTTLEVELIDNLVIKTGQKTLPIIIAFGDADSFSSYHRVKKSLAIALKK
ncbi:MAG: hypothetical protein JSV25_00600 [Spirochaetota bacterium]|nr:MAG: hypothetical protein JSV25_00600 [Spirochaetota bacterium]